ncbi:hypothetical protein RN001_016260 [Aquatica leii]|uniref:Uncharacterized protein n=1 Tax=Aquatica leii TaxID=1421715 RepID=A0AAN7P1H8_9COLE|nr:hypothetical protein RN001_016260 [Aquatica leii]
MASEEIYKFLFGTIENFSFMFNASHYELRHVIRCYGVEGIYNLLVSLLNALETIHLNLDELQKILDDNKITNGIGYQAHKYLTVRTSKKPVVANYYTKNQNQNALKEYVKHKTLRLRTYFYRHTNSLISERLWKYMHAKKRSKFVQSLLFFCLDYIMSTTDYNTQCTDQYRSILNLYGAFLFCRMYPNKKNVEFNEILFLKSRDGLSDPLRSTSRFPFKYVFVQYLYQKEEGNQRIYTKDLELSNSSSDILQVKNYSQLSVCTWTPNLVLQYLNKNFYYRPSDFEDVSQFILNMPSSSNNHHLNIGPENHPSDEDLKRNDLLLDWNYSERRYPYLDHREMASTSTGLYDWRRCYERFANVLIPHSSVLLRNQLRRIQPEDHKHKTFSWLHRLLRS